MEVDLAEEVYCIWNVNVSTGCRDVSTMILRFCYLTWLCELGLHNQYYLWSRRQLLLLIHWLHSCFFCGSCVVHVSVHVYAMFIWPVLLLYLCAVVFLCLDCPLYLWTGVLYVRRTYKFHCSPTNSILFLTNSSLFPIHYDIITF